MIKNFKVVQPPMVELGNLTLKNACSYYIAKDAKSYPQSFFAERKADGTTLMYCDWDRPENCPEGAEIEQQFDHPIEALLDYARWIKSDQKAISDGDTSPFFLPLAW